MRFVIINLLLVCLLLLGIGYLAFSDTGTDAETHHRCQFKAFCSSVFTNAAPTGLGPCGVYVSTQMLKKYPSK